MAVDAEDVDRQQRIHVAAPAGQFFRQHDRFVLGTPLPAHIRKLSGGGLAIVDVTKRKLNEVLALELRLLRLGAFLLLLAALGEDVYLVLFL